MTTPAQQPVDIDVNVVVQRLAGKIGDLEVRAAVLEAQLDVERAARMAAEDSARRAERGLLELQNAERSAADETVPAPNRKVRP